jgi:hypothetical protein
MLGFGLVWVKINGHIRQIPYFLKIATEDGFKTVCTLDTFTDSNALVSANKRRPLLACATTLAIGFKCPGQVPHFQN